MHYIYSEMEVYPSTYAVDQYSRVQSAPPVEREPEPPPESRATTQQTISVAPYPEYMGNNVDILI